MLVNDWSARDIQRWEAVPLGPFNSKNWVREARQHMVHGSSCAGAALLSRPPPVGRARGMLCFDSGERVLA